MDHQISSAIFHMSKTHEEMAKILQMKRDMAVHTSTIITAIPDDQPIFTGIAAVTGSSLKITESITAYLNGIADFEEAIAENLTYVMKEMSDTDAEE